MPTSAVVLIGPDHRRRQALVHALGQLSVRINAELNAYPSLAEAIALTDKDCDAVLIDLESDTEVALALVEDLSGRNAALTAMVYTRLEDPNLLVRSMQAGARALLQEPISLEALTGAVVRASARRNAGERRKTGGKTLVFCSVKGGAGASTIAANFAVSLAAQSGQKVALVDLNFELGDLAVLLNVSPKFSVVDAIESAARMDWDFLSGLMVSHKSGVSLLAAPDDFAQREFCYQPPVIRQMIRLLEGQFAYVVVDTAANRGLSSEMLSEAEAVYLVSQVDIPSLRHAQRLAAHLTTMVENRDQVQIVLNRYDARRSSIGADEIEKALQLPIAWRVPNDYDAVREAANTGLLNAVQSSTVGRAVAQMAKAACGQKAPLPEKKTWKLFG
ncbi:MAG: hypothetical protein ABI995_03060 [Acidobacteriota bacterium]